MDLKKHKEIVSAPLNGPLITVTLSIPHQDGLNTLFIKLNHREDNNIPTEKLLEMARFFLINNYSEFIK